MKNSEFKKWFAILLAIFFVLTACDQVGDLIRPKKLPELDAQGIQLSRDQVMPLDTVQAIIVATNPLEGPMQFQWLSDGGSFLAPSDRDTVRWVAPLSGGLYHLWVKVSNEDGSTESPKKQVYVISTSEPVVNIVQPADGSYFVLGQHCTVKVDARHENGISLVKLFVNGDLWGQTDQQVDGKYVFDFTVTEAMIGKTSLKAVAVAGNQLQSEGQDLIYIYVGGILPGGNVQ